jgi:DNA-directed RNA polymerase specialized sigma24 family protein
MALTEKEYNELYKYSLNIAYKYIGYKDSAYDIAQNAILAFMSSKAPITSPYMWLRTTVRREATKFLTNEKRESDTIQIRTTEKLTAPVVNLQDDSDDIFKFSTQKIKRILSPADYEIFKKFKQYDFSTAKFSEKENLSYNTVKTYKHRIRLNIISAYLLEDGWDFGIKILNYNQYVTMNRFTSQIISCVKDQKLSELRNYLQKIDNTVIQELLEGVVSCIEWSVTTDGSLYKLYMVCAQKEPPPKFIEFTVKFSKTNFIYIMDAKELKPYFVGTDTHAEEVRKYKVKGKITLTTEQIVSILSDKQTTI